MDTVSDDRIVQHINGTLRDKPLGIMLTGSFAIGSANAASDLDVFVITPELEIRRRFYRWDEGKVDVDLWEMTRSFIESSFARTPPVLYCFAVGRCLYETDGELTVLIARAKALYAAGPAAPTIAELDQFRHRAFSMLDDCRQIVSSEPDADAAFFLNETLRTLLRMHFAINRKWCHDNRRLISNLSQWDPPVANAAVLMLKESNRPRKLALLLSVAEKTLKSVGGTKKYIAVTYNERLDF